MTRQDASPKRRYPGLRPFERTQSAVFHGRGEDVYKLSNLVLRERVVVLFAKSGIGKTSLLQAGVAPELERQEFVPVFFRADKTDRDILEGIHATLQNAAALSGKDQTDLDPAQHQSLWELMKRLEFDLNGLPATPVLVFDQFEEVFTLSHSEQSRAQFLAELADLANETMPVSLRSRQLSRHQQGEINLDMMNWWERQPDLRIIIAIRSDFIPHLDSLSAQIPGILRNRFQLQALSREKARIAITQPAQAEGAFVSQPFRYSPEALQEIIDFLSGQNNADLHEGMDWLPAAKRDEIEAVNLQIVCQDIEERIIDWQKPEGFEVDQNFYDGLNGLKHTIKNFYQNQLATFPKAYLERLLQKSQFGSEISPRDKAISEMPAETLRNIAQRLIEESLITSGNRRNSVVDDTLLDDYKITPDFLDTLVDRSRLLRKEPRLDDFYYEISHDTLLPAIIESRNERRLQEEADREKAELEKRLSEEAHKREAIEAELKAAQQNRKLARTIAIVSMALAFIMVVFGMLIAYNYVKSIREELKDAHENVYNELFGAAIPTYHKLNNNTPRKWVIRHILGGDVALDLAAATALERKYYVVEGNLKSGDELFFTQKNYRQALSAYHIAQDSLEQYGLTNYALSNPNDTGRIWRVDYELIQRKFVMLKQRSESCRQIMFDQFKIAQRDFETFKEAGVWNMALRNLQKMERLLPQNEEDASLLQKALNLNESPILYVEREKNGCMAALGKRGIVIN